MIFFITNLFISFFVFLFCLYTFSKDDFIFLRKNVNLEQVFNYAFISVLISVFFGRVFYVFFHPSLQYINPLVFLIFIYFPGLSLTGGVIGVLIFLFFLSRKKKIPRGRMYDIFFLSFLPALFCNMLISQAIMLLLTKKISMIVILISIVFLIVFILFSIIFQKEKTKDGTIGIGIFILFSFISIIEKILLISNKKSVFFDKEVIVLVFLFILGIILLIKQKTIKGRR